MLNTLRTLADQNIIRPLDYHFARLLAESAQEPSPENNILLLAAALTSFELGRGHTCLHLNNFDLQELLKRLPPQEAINLCPPVHTWVEYLHGQTAVGDGSEATPLVLDNGRLYLMRYWQYETAIARRLNQSQAIPLNTDAIRESLDRLFPEPVDETDINWQKMAAAVAASRTISVISGGPGTGKTTTVTRLLALLVEQALTTNPDREPTIRLTAPTGKAAARLTESIGSARMKLTCDKEVRYAIHDQATTLHRLLGVIPGRPGFHHNRSNPLHLDILVVDEASMVDVSLMARLLEALPSTARLVLLGDREQLASVEAGSVLGDICSGLSYGYSHDQVRTLQQLTGAPLMEYVGHNGPSIRDGLCLLRKSYRFDANSGIGHLARAVNAGKPHQVKTVFEQPHSDLRLVSDGDRKQQLLDTAVKGYRAYLEIINQELINTEQSEPEKVLDAFDSFQVLCALREGDWGVEGLNNRIRTALTRAGLLNKDEQDSVWYHGRPVMITRNEPALDLFNGDIGISFRQENGRYRVIFPRPDGSYQALLPSRLPSHETVFAMTVHKSQGSEFKEVALALPDNRSPVLTRELVYTGITRAKSALTLLSPLDTLLATVTNPVQRVTGLAERLL